MARKINLDSVVEWRDGPIHVPYTRDKVRAESTAGPIEYIFEVHRGMATFRGVERIVVTSEKPGFSAGVEHTPWTKLPATIIRAANRAWKADQKQRVRFSDE